MTMNHIYIELREQIEREATKLFRLQRKALSHGCSMKLRIEILSEAYDCHQYASSDPGRILNAHINHQFKYAFK